MCSVRLRPRLYQRFGKAERLRKSSEYRRVGRKSRKLYGRFLIITYRSALTPCRRFGLVVSKRVGNAVVRNRVKRRLREAWRCQKSELPMCDCVLRARPSAATASYVQLVNDIGLLRKARLDGFGE